MLVLTVSKSRKRKNRDKVKLYVDPALHTGPFTIEVTLLAIESRANARIGFECPKEVTIVRKEVEDREQR